MNNVLLWKIAVSGVLAVLLLLPAWGAWTDYKFGKIRNSLTAPLFLLCVLAMATMKNGVDSAFAISLGIALGFWYAFYYYDRWGAGDGKYYVVLAWTLLVAERWFWFWTGILNHFTYASFAFFLIAVGWEFFKKLRSNRAEIRKSGPWWNFSHLNVAAFVYLWGQFVWPHLPKESPFLAMTLFFLVAMSLAGKVFHTKAAYVFPVVAIAASAYYGNKYGFVLSIGFTLGFKWLESKFEPVFETIDTKPVMLGELRQGDIVSSVSFGEIQEKTGILLRESPLQGDEIYELIEVAKKKKLLTLEVRAYESFKMGIALYAWYAFCIGTFFWKMFPIG